MAACNILMYSINIDDKFSTDDVVKKLENINLDETRIIIDEYGVDLIEGIYIYSEIKKIREYNLEKNIFEIVTQKRYVAVEFHINMKRKFLDVWGNQKNSQHIIAAISLAFDNNIIIEPSYFEFTRIIEFLETKNNVYINKVVANGLALEKNLIADCSFDLSGKENPFNIIYKYKEHIQKISFKWKCSNSTLSVVLYKSGNITIHKQRHLIDDNELVNIYKMLIYARR